MGMPSIESIINNWQLPAQLGDKFVTYILGEEQGYELEDAVDESFTFNDEELKSAGIVTANDRKLILAKFSGDLLTQVEGFSRHLEFTDTPTSVLTIHCILVGRC